MNTVKVHTHPISMSIDRISRIFTNLGFDIVTGPELETEWYNFDALNVAKNHSSRDMQDTFWIMDHSTTDKNGDRAGYVLRTHTSNMQIRSMEKHVRDGAEFPLAICCPGKVFRNEATDATHEAQFHQVEMLYVARDATLAMMIGVTQRFLTEFFESDTELKIRLRSSYFPFVEPGNEVDMQCFKCTGHRSTDGQSCNVCRGSGWIEIGGAGMVHPNVLKSGGVDAEVYKGFAFGCGIDRLAMLKWGVEDIRLLYTGDLRVVNQF